MWDGSQEFAFPTSSQVKLLLLMDTHYEPWGAQPFWLCIVITTAVSPGLAYKNIGYPVKFKFQISHSFSSLSLSCANIWDIFVFFKKVFIIYLKFSYLRILHFIWHSYMKTLQKWSCLKHFDPIGQPGHVDLTKYLKWPYVSWLKITEKHVCSE